MKTTIFDQIVTYVKGYAVWDGPNNTHIIRKMTVKEWLSRILAENEDTARFFEELRAMDKEERNEAKGVDVNLVMGAVADTVTKNQEDIKEYSGLVMIDIDGATDVPAMIIAMKKSGLFLASWRSLSYQGCHGIVACEVKANSVKQFNRIAQYVNEMVSDNLGVSLDDSVYPHIDPAEKRPLQGLAMSYDPEYGFLNENYTPLHIPEEVLNPPQTIKPPTYINNVNDDKEQARVKRHIAKLISNFSLLGEGSRFHGVSKRCYMIGGYCHNIPSSEHDSIIEACVDAYKAIHPGRHDHRKICESGFLKGLLSPMDLPSQTYSYYKRPDPSEDTQGTSNPMPSITPPQTYERHVCAKCTSKRVALYQYADGHEENLCNRCLHEIKIAVRPIKIVDYPEPERKKGSMLDKVYWEKYATDLTDAYYWWNSGKGKQVELRYCPKDKIDDRIKNNLEYMDDSRKLWRDDGEHCVASYVTKCYEGVPIAEDGTKPKITTLIGETTALIKNLFPVLDWDGYRERPGIIPFKEGVMYIRDIDNFNDADTRPYRAEDHFMIDQVLPIEWFHPKYLPADAKENMFASLIGKYDLSKEKEQTIYQMIGLTLICHYHKQKLFLISGAGNNGKSMLAKMIRKILGKNNCCSVVPQSLKHGSFSAVNLLGKMANLADDFPSDELKDISVLKGLCGNTSYTASRKYKSDIEFENYATMINICNIVPIVHTSESAWWRRVVPLELNKQFTPGSPDRIDGAEDIIDALPMEDMGIRYVVGKAVKEVWTLYKFNTELAWNPTNEEVQLIWDNLSNRVKEFIDKHCIRRDEAEISVREFNLAFNRWYTNKDKKNNRLGPKEIYKFMDLMGIPMEKWSYTEGSKAAGSRYWAGIEFNRDSVLNGFVDDSPKAAYDPLGNYFYNETEGK